MEEEMAKYIISRKDWSFASVEMGVNAVERRKGITMEEFEKRIDRFTAVLAEDPRPIFATSIFGFNDIDQERAEKYAPDCEKVCSQPTDLYRRIADIEQSLFYLFRSCTSQCTGTTADCGEVE